MKNLFLEVFCRFNSLSQPYDVSGYFKVSFCQIANIFTTATITAYITANTSGKIRWRTSSLLLGRLLLPQVDAWKQITFI